MAVSTRTVSDLYEILELSRNASAEDIKRNYQKLIKKVCKELILGCIVL